MTKLTEINSIDTSLRDYQIQSKKEIYNAFESSSSVMFQMPTGTGKTRLFVSIIKDIQEISKLDKIRQGVLILVHRTELIEQIHSVLGQKYHIAHGIIKSGYDQDDKYPVQIASVQTLMRRIDFWGKKTFDYIIIDEAHHAIARTYKNICKTFPSAKILGVTATPYRLGKESLRSIFGTLIVSQSIKKFIQQGYLSRYRYYSIDNNSKTQREIDSIDDFSVNGDYSENAMMRVCNTKKIRANIVEAYQKHALGKKGIIYTINQEHNRIICEDFEKIGVKIKAIDSKTLPATREKIVNEFKKGEIDIICNVNIFSEGFDCPDIEFIQLARPTCSLSMYLQQVGRGLRPHPNKTEAIILDNVGSYNKFGLPSADRQWRYHFEGKGGKVTHRLQVSSGGYGSIPNLEEGQDEMVLINSDEQSSTDESIDLDRMQLLYNLPLGGISQIKRERERMNNIIYQNSTISPEERKRFKAIDSLANSIEEDVSEGMPIWFKDIEELNEHLTEEYDMLLSDAECEDEPIEMDEYLIDRIISFTYVFEYNGKKGLVRKSSDKSSNSYQILLAPVFDLIGLPNYMDESVCMKDGKYGVIDGNSFTEIIPFEYDDILNINSYGYIVEKNGKQGYYHKGELIIACKYDELWCHTSRTNKINRILTYKNYGDLYTSYREINYSTGELFDEISPKFKVKKNLNKDMSICDVADNILGFSDKKGRLISPYLFGIYSKCADCSYRLTTSNDLNFCLDKNLHLTTQLHECVPYNHSEESIVDFVLCKQFEEISKRKEKEKERKTNEPAAIVCKDSKFGYTKNGKTLIDFAYDNIDQISSKLLLTRKDESYGIHYIGKKSTKELLKTEYEKIALLDKYIIAKKEDYSNLYRIDSDHLTLLENVPSESIKLSDENYILIQKTDSTTPAYVYNVLYDIKKNTKKKFPFNLDTECLSNGHYPDSISIDCEEYFKVPEKEGYYISNIDGMNIIMTEDEETLSYKQQILCQYHRIIFLHGKHYIIQDNNGKKGVIKVTKYKKSRKVEVVCEMKYDEISIDEENKYIIMKRTNKRNHQISIGE